MYSVQYLKHVTGQAYCWDDDNYTITTPETH